MRAHVWTTASAAVAVLLAAAGSGEPAWGAVDLEAVINMEVDFAQFRIAFSDRIEYEYGEGSLLHQHLGGRQWALAGTASNTQDVQDLADALNRKLASDGSSTKVSDLEVRYEFKMNPTPRGSVMDFEVEINGNMTDYVLIPSADLPVIDLSWRGLTVTDDVMIDGIPINIPANLLEQIEPEAYGILAGTEADTILRKPLMNAESILQMPIGRWHFAYDSIDGIQPSWHPGEPAVNLISVFTLIDKMEEGATANPVTVVPGKAYTVLVREGSDRAQIKVHGLVSCVYDDGCESAAVSSFYPDLRGSHDYLGVLVRVIITWIVTPIITVVAGISFFFIWRRSRKRRNACLRTAIC